MITITDFEILATERKWYDCWSEEHALNDVFMLAPETDDEEGYSFAVIRSREGAIISFESYRDLNGLTAATLRLDYFKTETPETFKHINRFFELIKSKTPISSVRRDYLKDYIGELEKLAQDLK